MGQNPMKHPPRLTLLALAAYTLATVGLVLGVQNFWAFTILFGIVNCAMLKFLTRRLPL